MTDTLFQIVDKASASEHNHAPTTLQALDALAGGDVIRGWLYVEQAAARELRATNDVVQWMPALEAARNAVADELRDAWAEVRPGTVDVTTVRAWLDRRSSALPVDIALAQCILTRVRE